MWVEIARHPFPPWSTKLYRQQVPAFSLSLSHLFLCAWGSEAEGWNVSLGGFKSAFHHM